jgi:serpin B
MEFIPFSLIACLALPPAAASVQPPLSTAADKAEAVEGNNAFAAALYGQLRNQGDNLFFSPASISTALAMTYAGARGETASEMASTLHFKLPPARLHPAMGALLADLNATHNGYELHAANALWAQRDYRILDDFLKLNKADYGAGFNQVDFKGATEAARSTINRWVEQKTNDKIKDLLQPGVLNSETKLVLTNAIYFKGDWQTPFEIEATKVEDFHLSSAQSVKAPLMHGTGAYNYLKAESLQALELPYKSGELSLVVFLPNEVNGLPALEQSMTAPNLKQWLTGLRPMRKVILTIPKFKLTRQFKLQETLGAMGMPKAFKASVADFSGMTGNRELCISAVIHKAFIDLDEQGTEAAAATAVVMQRAMMPAPDPTPPPVFRADHPFIFLIRDNRSGSILFMGRVTDPTK